MGTALSQRCSRQFRSAGRRRGRAGRPRHPFSKLAPDRPLTHDELFGPPRNPPIVIRRVLFRRLVKIRLLTVGRRWSWHLAIEVTVHVCCRSGLHKSNRVALTVNSPLKKSPGEGTGPTMHADFRGNLVGRVPSGGERDVFQQTARPRVSLDYPARPSRNPRDLARVSCSNRSNVATR